jgi:hypothetical protein
MTAITACPFCFAQKAAEAPLCAACGRETTSPPALLRERDELIAYRDKLISDLAAKMQRLSRR